MKIEQEAPETSSGISDSASVSIPNAMPVKSIQIPRSITHRRCFPYILIPSIFSPYDFELCCFRFSLCYHDGAFVVYSFISYGSAVCLYDRWEAFPSVSQYSRCPYVFFSTTETTTKQFRLIWLPTSVIKIIIWEDLTGMQQFATLKQSIIALSLRLVRRLKLHNAYTTKTSTGCFCCTLRRVMDNRRTWRGNDTLSGLRFLVR